jgi:hypothetical protein
VRGKAVMNAPMRDCLLSNIQQVANGLGSAQGVDKVRSCGDLPCHNGIKYKSFRVVKWINVRVMNKIFCGAQAG